VLSFLGLNCSIFRIGVILTALAAAPTAAAAFTHARAPVDARVGKTATLVQLSAEGDALSPALRSAGARLVAPGLDVWRLPARSARAALPALRAEGVLVHAEPDQKLISFTHLSQGDPLIPNEWWIHDVGYDQAEPPPPGIPVTVIDTGLDMSHPEFASRPNTVALDQQFVASNDDVHGTAVSSVVAAPSNGQGLVGIYPQAQLQEWDFGDGSLSDILAGLNAASRRGRGVVNFSGGFLGYSALLEKGVDRALHRGTVVVAAVGNDRQSGNKPFVPASLPHVLTVGANDQADHVANFSNHSGALDLVAPGVNIPVAVPSFYTGAGLISPGYASFDGTSFSSPLVAGATAWIWTLKPQLDATQIQDTMRDSARDVGPAGWDADTGFGILSVRSALTVHTPAKDPQEPNDDINLVRPHAVTASGTRLSTPTTLTAHMDVTEDPEDVYRVWVPAHGRIAARTRSRANVDLALWGPRTRTVFERGKPLRRDLLDFSQKLGSRSDLVQGANRTGRGAYFFVDAFLGKRVGHASYSLKVSVSRR
jgi:subtilisin family serine protease